MTAIDTTVYQNIVQAVNTLSLNYINVQGAQTIVNITAPTLVRSGVGRMCVCSITTAGSSNGTIYDSNSTSVSTSPIFTIPNTIGIIVVNLPVTHGIVVIPGTGQAVTVSYS